jgi:hypothetical protein
MAACRSSFSKTPPFTNSQKNHPATMPTSSIKAEPFDLAFNPKTTALLIIDM